MMEFNIATLIFIFGILVFLVNVIVEITKTIFPFNQVHTNIYTLVLSISLTVLSYFVYISYSCSKFIWYYLFAAVIVGFLVAYVAMMGYDKLIKKWKESQRGNLK